MYADVEHHTRRTHALHVQHAHVVARVLKVTEFLHQFLGVQCPAFAVAGRPADVASPLVEQLPAVDGRSDLEVVSGYAFVEHRGGLCPRGERVLARRYGPPHPARPAEVVGRAGVVDAAFVRGGDQAFERLHDVRDLEVNTGEIRHGLVREVLHPRL
ncbi:hypothetical protein D9M72_434850 [compost metagenome]